jgi:protocatechuate 3,4-dioxygenase beta subunit
MLHATNRLPMRASHLHFKLTARGMRTPVTPIFVRGDVFLASASVFDVKGSLIKDFVVQSAGTPTPDARDLGNQTWGARSFRHRRGALRAPDTQRRDR